MSSETDDKKGEQTGDNKVVPFPTHKIRKPKPQGAADAANPLPGLSPTRRKTLVVSLLSIMVMATLVATKVNMNHDAVRADRDLASVEQQQRRDLNEDIKLAKQISRQSLRSPASRGREPTPEEILSHVELASAYAIQYDKDGALRSIEYARQSGGQPKRLAAPQDFLLQHQDLFRLNFDNVAKAESIRDNDGVTEIYELRQKDVTIAKVHFQFQNDQELSLMKVELSEDTKRHPADDGK